MKKKEPPEITGREPPYLDMDNAHMHYRYNPKYGDDKKCVCGHPYYRHFDSYEEMFPIGCKYCGCFYFRIR